MRRKFIVAAVLLVFALAGYITWTLLGWPPPGMLLRYGIPPYCAPTGRTLVIEGIEFVEISPGCFRMGSEYMAQGGDFLGRVCAKLGFPWGQQPKPSDEMPVHWVEFPRGFIIARHEVTNAQYQRFDLEHERSEFSPGDGDPVVEVSWHDARSYCASLSERTGYEVRLPSEAEWECAARAGSETEYCFGDDEAGLSEYAWYGENSGGRAREVGTHRANAWGLKDLHGNVWEWCEDNWHPSYMDAPGSGSAWVEQRHPFEQRVCRGGYYRSFADICRSATRSKDWPQTRCESFGFRPAITPPRD